MLSIVRFQFRFFLVHVATKASRTLNRAVGVNQSVRLLRVEVAQEFIL